MTQIPPNAALRLLGEPREARPPPRYQGADAVLNLTVRLEPLKSPRQLAQDWRALEAQAVCSYFISWHWIENWLATLPADIDLWLLSARRSGLPVGLAILVRRTRHRLILGQIPSWALHATGRNDLDVIFIEHNDFLVHAGDAPAIRAAMLDEWRARAGPRAELHLPGVRRDDWTFTNRQSRLSVEGHSQPAFAINVSDPLNWSSVADITRCFSARARRNVRRSRKLAEKQGALLVREPTNIDEAMRWFSEMLALNARRLASKGINSDCQTPHFQRFHKRLLACAIPGARIVRIDAGERCLGYVYAFVHGAQAYVYQSGFDYSALGNTDRPGLVSHSQVAQTWAQRDGILTYDLMAGDAHYKASLSNHQVELAWLKVQPQHWSHALDQFGFRVRHAHWVNRLITLVHRQAGRINAQTRQRC